MANEFIARKGLIVQGGTSITGSVTVISGGVTGSLYGTSSWAEYAISASWAPSTGGGSGTVTSIDIGNGLTGTNDPITTTGDISLDTGSTHFTSGVVSSLPTGTVSSSIQINTGSFSGSFFGTSSWATNAVSSSLASNVSIISAGAYETGSDIPVSIRPDDSASYALTASFAVSASWAPKESNVRLVSSNGSIFTTDNYIVITSGFVTMSLPLSNDILGQRFFIKNLGTGQVQLLPSGSNTIDNYSTMTLEQTNSSIAVVSIGSAGWIII